MREFRRLIASVSVSSVCLLGWTTSSTVAASDNDSATFLERAATIVDKTVVPIVKGADKAATAVYQTDLDHLQTLYRGGASAFDPDALQAGHAVLNNHEILKITNKAGKFAGPLSIALKTIKFGSLVHQCYQAGATGSEEAFSEHFNKLVREAVGEAARHAGSVLGLKAGAAVGLPGGPLAVLTGAVGYFAGGWIAEQGVGWAYDQFLQDWIKDDVANRLYETFFAANIAESSTTQDAQSSTSQHTRAPPTSLTLAIIVDKSGSMGSQNKIGQAKQAVLSVIRSLSKKESLILVAYDSRGALLFPHGNSQDPKAVSAIEGLASGGGTDIADGLRTAFTEIERSAANGSCVALLMTDGEDNNHGAIKAAVKDYTRHSIPVYTVAFGSDARDAILNLIADRSGGELLSADSGSLVRAFAQILNEIQTNTDLAMIHDIIRQDEEKEHIIDVPPGTEYLRQTLSWAGSHVGLVLVAPSGHKITPKNAMLFKGVSFLEDLAHNLTTVRIDRPLAGLWKLITQGLEIPPEGEPYSLSVSAATPLETRLLPLHAFYQPGEDVVLGVTVLSDRTLTTEVEGFLHLARHRVRLLPINDGGQNGDNVADDDLYSCRLRIPENALGLFPLSFVVNSGSQRNTMWATLQVGKPDSIGQASSAGYTHIAQRRRVPVPSDSSALVWLIAIVVGVIGFCVVGAGVGGLIYALHRTQPESNHKVFTIGRGPDSNIVLSDKLVSFHHAELRFEDGRWVITDLGSSNGVLVNGQPVRRQILTPADMIRFGVAEYRASELINRTAI